MGKGGGGLFEAWHLLILAIRVGAYSKLGAFSNKYGTLVKNKNVLTINKTY